MRLPVVRVDAWERGVGMFKRRQEGVCWGLIDAGNDLLEGPGSVP